MNKPVSEIVKEVKDFSGYTYIFNEDVSTYDENIDIYSCLNKSTPEFSKNPIKVEKICNNIKYYFENDEWILLRISGTEPVIRVFIEMKDSNDVCKNKTKLNAYIDNLTKQLV